MLLVRSLQRRLHQWLSRPEVRTPLAIGALTRVIIIVVAFLALRLLGAPPPPERHLHGGDPFPVSFLDNFQRHETYRHLSVAREGYHLRSGTSSSPSTETADKPSSQSTTPRPYIIAPFPLFPLLIWLFSLLVVDPTVAGLLLSLSAYLTALVLYYRLVVQAHGADCASRAVLYLSVFPTAWLFNSVDPESLLLLLLLLTLMQARQGRVLGCALFGAAAALTRVDGALLASCAMVELVLDEQGRPVRQRLWPVLLAGAAPVAAALGFFGCLYSLTGDFWVFFRGQDTWCGALATPWYRLWEALGPGLLRSPLRLINICAVGLFACATYWGRGLQHPGHTLLSATGILAALTFRRPRGQLRHLLSLFPAQTVLALGGRSRFVHLAIVTCFCMLLAVLMVSWIWWRYRF